MLEDDVLSRRIDARGSMARCKDTETMLDAGMKVRPDAELFPAVMAGSR